MKTMISHQLVPIIAAIEQAGVWERTGLRLRMSVNVSASDLHEDELAVLHALVFVLAGVLIFRKRRPLFDRDPNVMNDDREVRDDRRQLILMVWGGLTSLIVGILIDVWRA